MADEKAKDQEQPTQVANVTISVTSNGQVSSSNHRFHTPTLLDEVSKVDDGCGVKITVVDPGATEPRVLFDGTKADAVEALKKSIVPNGNIDAEIRKFMQFMLDHSSMKAVGVHAIFAPDAETNAGFGFITTAPDCTNAQAVALVNCGDANIHEFITKAKIDIPGRESPGGIVKPTKEQVDALG